MPAKTTTALALTEQVRSSPGFSALSRGERERLELDLSRIEATLKGEAAPRYGSAAPALDLARDPYAVPLETPAQLNRGLLGDGSIARPAPAAPTAPPSSPNAATRRPGGTETIGQRARQALEAVNFTSFVAGLVDGTFQAIVDATSKQVREYAKLVASISQSLDDFTADNVSVNQARDWLLEKFPSDLSLTLPKTGERGEPRLSPRRRSSEPPAWLDQFGLGGQELTPELVEGPLLDAARRGLGEERLSALATMVLMGINRIVIDDGQIKARLQFHASARESTKADATLQGVTASGIAGRQIASESQVSTLVSTVNVNAQSNDSIKADLMGEVSIRFRTETFNLERFADSQAIQLINRHARTPNQAPAAPGTTPASTPGTAPNPPPRGGNT